MFYQHDFDREFKTKEEIEQFLLNHFEGDTTTDTETEYKVIEAMSFDEDAEPVGFVAEHTVAINPIMRWTAHDSERGEDYGVPTGSHEVYWI